jgi:hypothetical protein
MYENVLLHRRRLSKKNNPNRVAIKYAKYVMKYAKRCAKCIETSTQLCVIYLVPSVTKHQYNAR